MDVVIPFSTSFTAVSEEGYVNGFAEAVEVAKKAAEGTRDLKAKFGRASYVGVGDDNGEEKEGVPDPGAWAFWEILRGVREGLGGV